MNLGGRGCGEQRLHHCTPAWATEPDSVSKKKKRKKRKKVGEEKKGKRVENSKNRVKRLTEYSVKV